MPLIFQSNPDRWDIRLYLKPGEVVQWFVSRYKSLMMPGNLVLFWSAKGAQPPGVRGLYGWGIASGYLFLDKEGRQRLPVRYIERWIHPKDVELKTTTENQIAALSADSILNLPSWSNHLLAVNPIGGNFVISREQMNELLDLVKNKFPQSQLIRAFQINEILNSHDFDCVILEGGK